MREQTAVELVVVLAVSLLILFVIISSQYVGELSSSKAIAEARSTVDDLAVATRNVY